MEGDRTEVELWERKAVTVAQREQGREGLCDFQNRARAGRWEEVGHEECVWLM